MIIVKPSALWLTVQVSLLDPREVVLQVEDAMSRGAQEVVLTGINLGSYKVQLED